ncbi:hypothetical protein [Streptomyces telluris]|uniref:Lipoprotein n=1 Tax=Streptomyces telluris TaxID=2720021 RepID=A0A9X2LIM2_9ACTN|nr:hypothetical protein [Streptomyces telluris]MCQ8771843.1 hypothetical protein [Streptomyces telluris]NJP81690.1 hypothetical protein [Streptomyces telluris]
MTLSRTRTPAVRLGVLPVMMLAVLAAGCGTQRSGDTADADRRWQPTPTRAATGSSTPSSPVDLPCPGESPASAPQTTAPPSGPAAPPTDHYAENHGFRVPLPLRGQSRCDGLAAVRRIKDALEPLRERGDFAPEDTRNALTGLGYSAGKVQAHRNGPTGVGFLIDTGGSPRCVEGTMDRASVKADAFGGYPDHSGCDVPSGGH